MESKSAGVNSGIHLRKRTPFVAVSILNSFRTGAQRRKKRVIPVQDGRPAFFQPAEDLAFGAQDVFPAAEIADVGVSHIRDHRHVGLRDADQIVDLAQMIHPHLQDRDLVLLAQAENSHRESHMIVQVAGGLEGSIF